MDAPDVLGLEWEEAELLLNEAGWTATVKQTAPPQAPARPGESLRVVRVSPQAGSRRVVVLLAPERFLGAGRSPQAARP